MLHNKHIDQLRDLALVLEQDNLELSYKLMKLAHDNRPNGSVIKKKLEEYSDKIKATPLTAVESKVQSLLEHGEVVLIPVGFRCMTKLELFKSLNFSQASLPFDSGFFPPQAVANLLRNRVVDLKWNDNGLTHQVCIKKEGVRDEILGPGIVFTTSDYNEIDSLVTSPDVDKINQYLDSTFGYYTLDTLNKYVLAHYNWHRFSPKEKSKGVYDTQTNLKNINSIINNRIERMFELCERAKCIFFVFGEYQNFKYMKIDNETYDLTDLSPISECVNEIFGDKGKVVSFSEVDTLEKIAVHML